MRMSRRMALYGAGGGWKGGYIYNRGVYGEDAGEFVLVGGTNTYSWSNDTTNGRLQFSVGKDQAFKAARVSVRSTNALDFNKIAAVSVDLYKRGYAKIAVGLGAMADITDETQLVAYHTVTTNADTEGVYTFDTSTIKGKYYVYIIVWITSSPTYAQAAYVYEISAATAAQVAEAAAILLGDDAVNGSSASEQIKAINTITGVA